MHGHPGVTVTNHGHQSSKTRDALCPAQLWKCSPIFPNRQLEFGAGCMEIGIVMFSVQDLEEGVQVFLPGRIVVLGARCSAK
jgi:hypothetical protein